MHGGPGEKVHCMCARTVEAHGGTACGKSPTVVTATCFPTSGESSGLCV